MCEVFFFETYREEQEELVSRIGARFKARFTPCAIQETDHRKPPAGIISIRTQSVIPPSWAPALTAVLSRSAGYDHLVRFRREVEVPPALGYLPDYCSKAVAEQAILFMLALMRRLPLQMEHWTRFDRDGLTGEECEDKVLLVVGVGRIGKRAVDLARGLNMHTLGVDIDPRHDSVEYVSIAEGLGKADVMLCAMNLTADNAGYFNRDRFRKLGKPAYFINIARGEFAPAADVLAALEEGRLRGAALDVFSDEGRLATDWRSGTASRSPEAPALLRLARRPDVILTPHNAFNTRDATERKAGQSVAQLVQVMEHGRFIWNIPADYAV